MKPGPHHGEKSVDLLDSEPANLSDLSDAELARRAQAGCGESFETLVERFGPMLTGYLSRRCGNATDVEDLRQETLLRLWRKIESYDPRRPFGPWLMAVAGNVANTRLGRRSEAADTTQVSEPQRAAPDQVREFIEREHQAGLWKAAEKLLSEKQYTALHMRYASGMSVREIARLMGLTRTHVKVMLFRARRRLADSRAMDEWK